MFLPIMQGSLSTSKGGTENADILSRLVTINKGRVRTPCPKFGHLTAKVSAVLNLVVTMNLL